MGLWVMVVGGLQERGWNKKKNEERGDIDYYKHNKLEEITT